MHNFQQQDSTQSLAQGIDEYFAANPGLTQAQHLSPQARQFFRCHDTAHVVFGCGTALDDEAVVKIASIFGTTAGWGVLKGYRLHESRRIYRELRVMDMLASIAHAIVLVPRTIARCRAQRARWPWDDHQPYLHTPLQELRRHFGITVAHRQAG
jgi:hypothetical protein